jgi:RNA polymerase sigma-70 factor (ECF subfamily)
MNSNQRYLSFSQCASQEVTTRDEELLLAARAGSQAAFAELQNIHAHRLYSRILSITRNREDAEDALQDTFFHAYRALPSFEGRSKLSSWLMRIAINSALMILRKRRIRPEMSFEQQTGAEDDGSWFDVRDSAMNPEQLYDQQQRCDAVLRDIQRLNPKMRNALSIRISQDNSMQEIALSLGVSSASVKATLHRARKRLVQSAAFRDHSAKMNPPNRRTLICCHDNRENHV